MKSILSFDQASNVSGFCYSEDGKIIESGVIDKHSNKDIETRIPEMAVAICAKIKELKPELVVIENIQNQNSTKTVIQLARLQGGIILYCASKGIELKIVGPSEWRKQLNFVQGPKVKREELKQQSLSYVKENFGLEVPEDCAEAICINAAAQIMF